MDKKKILLKEIEEKIKNFDKEKLISFLTAVSAVSAMRYSVTNQMLIAASCGNSFPGVVMGYKSWQKYGHRVKKGERGIAILAPVRIKKQETVTDPDTGEEKVIEVEKTFFKTVYVFTEAQTVIVDPELDKKIPRPHFLKGDAEELYKKAKDIIKKEVSVIEEEIPDRYTGGYTDGEAIFIKKDLPTKHKFHTLIHEYTHYIKNHVNNPDKTENEIVAETSALTCLKEFGIDSSEYSIEYIVAWMQEAKSILKFLKEGIATGEKIAQKIKEEVNNDRRSVNVSNRGTGGRRRCNSSIGTRT